MLMNEKKKDYVGVELKDDQNEIDEDIPTTIEQDAEQDTKERPLRSRARLYQKVVHRTLCCLVLKAALCTILALVLTLLVFDRAAASPKGFLSSGVELESDATKDATIPSIVKTMLQDDYLHTQHGKDTMQKLQATLRDLGSMAALQDLENFSQVDVQIEDNCHTIAHALGKFALKEKGFVEALDNLPGSSMEHALHLCNGGFIHAIEVDFIVQQANLTFAVDYVEENLCQLLLPQEVLQKGIASS